MNKFEAITAFCKAAKNANFSQSARELGISATMVSKHIQSLESDLGCRLFNRNTRKVQLTQAGIAYYQKISPLLSQMNDLNKDMASYAEEPRGQFTVSTSIEFGSQFLATIVTQFCERYPQVSLNLEMDNNRVSLLDDNIDIAIRVAPHLPDSSLIAVPIATTQLKTWASPQYLKQFGVPSHPLDLNTHRCLYFNQTPRPDTWLFSIDNKQQEVPLQWFWSSNNGRVLNEAAAAGQGVVQAPDYSVYQYQQKGSLVEILSDYQIDGMTISAVYSHRHNLSINIKRFLELLERSLSPPYPWLF